MTIWDNDNRYLYTGQDGLLFVYQAEEETQIPSSPMKIAKILVKCAAPEYLGIQEITDFLKEAGMALANNNVELHMSGIGRIRFETGKIITGPFPAATVLIPSEVEGSIIVFSTSKSEEMTKQILTQSINAALSTEER